MATAVVGIIMGSTSDWETMQHCAQTLDGLGVGYEARDQRASHAATDARVDDHGGIAGPQGGHCRRRGRGGTSPAWRRRYRFAGPGVPMESASLKGLDSLLSMVQMPAGVPVATFALKAGCDQRGVVRDRNSRAIGRAHEEGARRLPDGADGKGPRGLP
jgi:5-(carboxyamino)imidazole ribonucleotide mutase